MRLPLNLTSATARRRRLFRRALGPAVLVLLLVTVLHALLLFRWQSRLAGLEETWVTRTAELERVRAGTAAATAAANGVPTLAERIRFYNSLLEASAFSWTGLLNELEAALPEGVGLTEVRPDQTLTGVQLRGEARTLEALTGFVRRLEERPLFARVFLLRHGGGKDARGRNEIFDFDIRLDLKRERT